MPLDHVPWPLASHLELAALDTAIPCARWHAKQMLWEWGLGKVGDLEDNTELLVAELIPNAYQTTVERKLTTPLGFRLASNRQVVLVEVWDGGTTPRPHK